MNGTVVRLNDDKGFGFIRGEDGADRFFHSSGLQPGTRRFEELRIGDPVEFTHTDGPKGPRAEDVRVLRG